MQSSVLANLIKSQSDSRLYRLIKLPNQLKCLLVQDAEADKAAAALDVKVGCALDPKEFAGTAHFLEHMLFMGSEKYPEENAYSVYVKDNGGYSNAFTSLSNTAYFFEVSNEAFEGALDRFSQFFKAPMFSETSTQKEMNAVDAEYQMSITNDFWKQFVLLQMNSNPKSRFNRFDCGSLETLQQDGIRENLLDFHKKWYSSNLMNFVSVSNHTLDQQEEWARSMLSGVENKQVELPDLIEEHPWTENERGLFLKHVPVKDKDQISVSWTLPYLGKEVESKPLSYHSHLFGHEGPNSLLSYLSREGLAQGIVSRTGDELWGYSTFTVDVDLTKKGLEEYERVLQAVFRYAQIVKESGPQQFVFDELKRIGEISFQFMQKGKAASVAQKYAGKMHYFEDSNVEKLLSAAYLHEAFDKEMTQKISEILTDPNNCYIQMKSKSFEGKTDKHEKWYKTDYIRENFKENGIFEKLQNPPQIEGIGMPPKNNFLPQKLEVLPKDEALSKEPFLLTQGDGFELWYQKDDKFEKPEAIYSLKYYTSDAGIGTNVESRVFLELWDAVLEEEFREIAYLAEMAKLQYSHSLLHDNFQFKWSGYDDSMPAFIAQTLEFISNFNKNLGGTEAVFNRIKEKIMQDYGNSYLQAPYIQAFYLMEPLMVNTAYEKKELLKAMQAFTFERFVALSKTWLKSGKLVAFCNGNISADSAKSLMDITREKLNVVPVGLEVTPSIRSVALQPCEVVKVQHDLVSPDEANSATLMFFQDPKAEGTDYRTKVISEVLRDFIDEPTFARLRTDEQLGYVVFSLLRGYRDVNGIVFLVQSTNKSAAYLASRMWNNLQEIKKTLEALTDEEFKVKVASTHTRLAEKDIKLAQHNTRMMTEISTNYHSFGRQKAQVDELSGLTKADLVEAFEERFFRNPRILELSLISPNHKEQQVKDLEELTRPFYADQGIDEVNVGAGSLAAMKSNMMLHPDPFKRLVKQAAKL